jgi:hypothetical protein
MTEVVVEFFGIPRQRAGCMELRVPARTAAEALAVVEQRCPQLAGLLAADRLDPLFLLSIDGVRFVDDLGVSLRPGARLLLLSADAGG